MIYGFCYAAVVLLAFFSFGRGQWQQGVPVSKAQTIRVAVDAGPVQTAPEAPGPKPLATSPEQGKPSQAQVPTRAQAPFQGRPMANQPAANNFFNQFSPFLYDNDIFQNRICGMSRRAMSSPRAQSNFWGLNMMHFGNVFTCSCWIGEGAEMESIDYSLQARRDCMTRMTGLMCCLT